MDNDGDLDVVVAHNGENFVLSNRSTDFISILLNNGDGSLQPALDYNFDDGLSPTAVEVIDIADVNGDGLKDVVLAVNVSSSLGNIWILMNQGNGTFRNAGRRTIGSNILGIKAVKVNGDRYVDYVVTTNVGVVVLFGTSELFVWGGEQRDINIDEQSLAACDFDRDGQVDLAVVPWSGSQIRIFMNSAFGLSQSPVIYQTESRAALLRCLDVNRDGFVDLFATGADGNFRVLYGSSDGTFSNSETIPSDLRTSDVVLDDFDRNGKLDIGASIYDPGDPNSMKAAVMLNAPNQSRYYTDFDGDARSDHTIFRPSRGEWWTKFAGSDTHRVLQFGLGTDSAVPANYDGDDKADIAVFRDGVWYILQSSDGTVKVDFWGTHDDIPVPADYDNDGTTDLAVFRQSTGEWYIKRDNGFDAIQWGSTSDRPIPADFDGDGKFDIAVFRPNEGGWYIRRSADNGVFSLYFGSPGDIPVPADFDGDGRADIAVFRAVEGNWYILQSSNDRVEIQKFGQSGDWPVPYDFDGDGRNDIAVFRSSESNWYVLQSSDGQAHTTSWGSNGDVPAASAR